ncbi:hypothetical protein NECAME_02535 [Necator americanus]|uniref:Tyrosinase copper-binding domain-containing protein n=1 Tax=Necator americanus TaxID=51031 RepID=W2TFB2_NECAM|nr:hypothetical protein NECAME_02535 [Necator americanus]ETN79712.1 hypothetical protein NECAME_02535 [Necator americanus]
MLTIPMEFINLSCVCVNANESKVVVLSSFNEVSKQFNIPNLVSTALPFQIGGPGITMADAISGALPSDRWQCLSIECTCGFIQGIDKRFWLYKEQCTGSWALFTQTSINPQELIPGRVTRRALDQWNGQVTLFSFTEVADIINNHGVNDLLGATAGGSGCPNVLVDNIELVHGDVHVWIGADMQQITTSTNDPIFFLHHSFIDSIWEQWRQLRQGCPNVLVDNIELVHGDVHVWIGADMQQITTSTNDPIFFLHHSFIDNIWEQWRQLRQTRSQRETQWNTGPTSCYSSAHQFNAAMVPFTGLTNRVGLSNAYTDYLYNYAPSPSCAVSYGVTRQGTFVWHVFDLDQLVLVSTVSLLLYI